MGSCLLHSGSYCGPTDHKESKSYKARVSAKNMCNDIFPEKKTLNRQDNMN